MEQKILKAELARGEVRNMYLLYGEERFLVKHYAAEIEKACGGDSSKDVFEGNVPVEKIIMAAETLPFSFGGDATEKRLIIVRDSKLFAMAKKSTEAAEGGNDEGGEGDASEEPSSSPTLSGRKAEAEKMAEYLPKIPTDTVLVFIETDVDRRTRLFKKTTELGGAVELSPLSSQDLAKWITREARKKDKIIAPSTMDLFLRTCGNDMFNLANELDKLLHYCGSNLQNSTGSSHEPVEITPADISAICSFTPEARIFDLLKALGAGRTADALKMYADMLSLKESPYMILAMITRQLRIILLCKCHAEKNTPYFQISRELGIRDFVVPEAVSHGQRFTADELISALERCQDTDIKIKTGLLDPEIGVELLIISLAK